MENDILELLTVALDRTDLLNTLKNGVEDIVAIVAPGTETERKLLSAAADYLAILADEITLVKTDIRNVIQAERERITTEQEPRRRKGA